MTAVGVGFRLYSERSASGCPTAAPTRQPAMLCDFDSVLNSIATSFAPGPAECWGSEAIEATWE